jgi:hypothetical protein
MRRKKGTPLCFFKALERLLILKGVSESSRRPTPAYISILLEYFFVSFYTARLGGFYESSGLNKEHFSEKNKARLAMLNLDVHGIYKFFCYEVL